MTAVKRDPEARAAYTITEVARIVGRNRTTVHRGLERGVLREIRIPGSARMVDARSLDRLLNGDAPRPKQ